jgi:hypothetical protein
MPTPYITETLIGSVKLTKQGPQVDRHWTITGQPDPQLAFDLLLTLAAPPFLGLVLLPDSVELAELGGGVWECSANYGTLQFTSGSGESNQDKKDQQQQEPDEDAPIPFSLSGSTIGNPPRPVRSIETIKTAKGGWGYTAGGEVAPNFGRLIHLDKDGNPQPVEPDSGRFEWTWKVRRPNLSHRYLRTVAETLWMVSDTPWAGYDAGEMQFHGMSWEYVSGDGKKIAPGWDCTYKFVIAPNESNKIVGQNVKGPIIVDAKKGHHFLWVLLREEGQTSTDGNVRRVTVPWVAYVEQIYPEGDIMKRLDLRA